MPPAVRRVEVLSDEPGNMPGIATVYECRASVHVVEVSLITGPDKPTIHEETLRRSLDEDSSGGDLRCEIVVTSEGDAGSCISVRAEVAAKPDAEPGAVLEKMLRRISCIAATGEAIMHTRVLREQVARRADPDALEDICRKLRESKTSFEVGTLFETAPDAGVWVSGVDRQHLP